MASPPSDLLYPFPDPAALSAFIGQPVSALPMPAAVIDRAIVERNCARLLDATKALGVGFRPHVKTHKTTAVTRLQLGDAGEGKVVVSTVREAECLEDLMKEGLVKDVLYGLPAPPSSIPRLAALRRRNPTVKFSLLVDHPDQLPALQGSEPDPWHVFIKLEYAGYNRAGVPPSSQMFSDLLTQILAAEGTGSITLAGVYCHAGSSYAADSPASGFSHFAAELETVHSAAERIPARAAPLTLSVGASPTALAATGAAAPPAAAPSADEERARALMATIARSGAYALELHAGVYALLDLQQLATRVLRAPAGLADVAFSVAAEVLSVYGGRGAGGGDEALVGVGTLGLGREPGRADAWPGWGCVRAAGAGPPRESGWVVGRIAQEHGVLTQRAAGAGEPLRVGQRVRIWPQHACVAAAGYGWFFVVDGADGGETVRDVWPRWRGW